MAPKKTDKGAKFMNDMMDDIFHPNEPICQIITTNAKTKKKDVFSEMRPEPYTCLDYSISQTDARLDAGCTKIHIQQTEATYEPLPPEAIVKKPKKTKKKIKYFDGGPPQWEFVDEIWNKQQEEKQKMYVQQLKERLENERKLTKKKR